MELAEYTGKPCRSKMAYEFLPNKKISINLEKAAEELSKISLVEVTTKVLVMAKMDAVTISLFASGKILVRGERDEDKAKKIAQIVLKQLN